MHDEACFALKGYFRDRLRDGSGTLVLDSGWRSNTIVVRCRILLAGFMKNEAASGIQSLAVGQGSASWDIAGPPAPDPAASTDLVTRYEPALPLADLDIVYLDESDAVVAGPTSRLQVTATLEPGYPAPLAPLDTYPLREFGLFGSFDGASYMINSIRHPVIHKDSGATLIRVIRLHF